MCLCCPSTRHTLIFSCSSARYKVSRMQLRTFLCETLPRSSSHHLQNTRNHQFHTGKYSIFNKPELDRKAVKMVPKTAEMEPILHQNGAQGSQNLSQGVKNGTRGNHNEAKGSKKEPTRGGQVSQMKSKGSKMNEKRLKMEQGCPK